MLGMKRTVIVCAVLASAVLGAYHVVADAGSCPEPAAAACAAASVAFGPPAPPPTGVAVCADNTRNATCSAEQCNRCCGPTCDPSACVNR